jgi:hypothetical protein
LLGVHGGLDLIDLHMPSLNPNQAWSWTVIT